MLLALNSFSDSHSGEALAKVLHSVMCKFKIEDRVRYFLDCYCEHILIYCKGLGHCVRQCVQQCLNDARAWVV